MLLQHRVLVPTTDTRPTAVRTFFESTTDVMVFSCYVAGVVPAHAGVLSLRRGHAAAALPTARPTVATSLGAGQDGREFISAITCSRRANEAEANKCPVT